MNVSTSRFAVDRDGSCRDLSLDKATFRDVLAGVRRHLWGHETFPTSSTDPDVVLLPRSTLERLS